MQTAMIEVIISYTPYNNLKYGLKPIIEMWRVSLFNLTSPTDFPHLTRNETLNTMISLRFYPTLSHTITVLHMQQAHPEHHQSCSQVGNQGPLYCGESIYFFFSTQKCRTNDRKASSAIYRAISSRSLIFYVTQMCA